MADSQKTVRVQIDVAVAQAKAALADISTQTEKASKSLKDMGVAATKGGDEIAASAKKAGDASGKFFNQQTKDFVKGLASYDLLKEAIKGTTGFLVESVRASMNAGAAWAQVRTDVENAGISYESISAQLKDYSEKTIQLGFDDEETAKSVARLTVVTGNYSDGLKLNQLAMDLARSKNLDLAPATNLVGLVTQGQGRLLKQYGIELDDNASSADNLAKLQDKVADSAVNFAKTTANQLQVAQIQWENLQQTVGDELAPTLTEFFKVIEKQLPQIEKMAGAVGGFFAAILKSVGIVVDALDTVGTALGNIDNILSGKEAVTTDSNNFFNKLTKSVQNFGHELVWGHEALAATTDAAGETAQATDEAAAAADKAAKSFDGIGTSAKADEKALQQLADAYQQVSQSTQRFTFETTDDFARYEAILKDTTTSQDEWVASALQGFSAFTGALNNVNKEIDDLNGKLTDTRKSFDDFVKTTTASASDNFAQIVFDAQQAVKDLPKQISEAKANGQDTTDLNRQLRDARSVLKTAQEQEFKDNTEFQDQLAFLKSQAGKNELQQAVALTDRKIEQKRRETDEEIADIQKQIDAVTAQRDAYATAQVAMTKAFKDNITARTAGTAVEIANMQALTAAVNAAAAAYARLGAGTTTGSAQKRAAGGPVSAGETYLVGEKGPELFTPGASGSITPNDKIGGGITVNIMNPTVRNDGDLRAIIGAVADALGRRDELARMGALK